MRRPGRRSIQSAVLVAALTQIQLVGSKPHDAIAGRAFGDFDFYARMLLPVAFDQGGEEAAGDKSIDADAKAASFSRCRHAGRFHGMVEVIDARRHMLDEAATGFRQPNASRVAKIEMFGDRKRLD